MSFSRIKTTFFFFVTNGHRDSTRGWPSWSGQSSEKKNNIKITNASSESASAFLNLAFDAISTLGTNGLLWKWRLDLSGFMRDRCLVLLLWRLHISMHCFYVWLFGLDSRIVFRNDTVSFQVLSFFCFFKNCVY